MFDKIHCGNMNIRFLYCIANLPSYTLQQNNISLTDRCKVLPPPLPPSISRSRASSSSSSSTALLPRGVGGGDEAGGGAAESKSSLFGSMDILLILDFSGLDVVEYSIQTLSIEAVNNIVTLPRLFPCVSQFGR